MDIPFGYAGAAVIAVILYFLVSWLTETILEKKGIKPSQQYKDLQEDKMNPAGLTGVVAAATVMALYFTTQYTKFDWKMITVITIAITAATAMYAITKGSANPNKITRA